VRARANSLQESGSSAAALPRCAPSVSSEEAPELPHTPRERKEGEGGIGVKLRKSCQRLSPGRGARLWPIAKAMGPAHFLGFYGKPREGRQNRVRGGRNSSVAAAAAGIASPAQSHGFGRGPHSTAPTGAKTWSRLLILTPIPL